MNILITGTAGFIGYHLAEKLLNNGHQVTGLDHINDYYDINLKYNRLKNHGIEKGDIVKGEVVQSKTLKGYRFIKTDLQDKETINTLFEEQKFDVVVNLAAQAGVRHSLSHPQDYIDYNVTGFLNIIEACRTYPVKHLIYASSSSVYGLNTNMPFSVKQNVDHPVSLYAATKKSNELMAHTYSHLFNIPTTGLRFFTVYGPWGRPDMALFLFTKAMLEGDPIKVFNYGKMQRDFTYIDDIVESISRLVPKPPEGNENWSGDNPDPSTAKAPYQLFNIGHNSPVKLMDFIREIEKQLGIEAEKNMMPIQPGDVPAT
ncbi:MAG: NAD-dependent epimerase/dehydratase family protein, partial [Candidatus Paceibacterota bacterium]